MALLLGDIMKYNTPRFFMSIAAKAFDRYLSIIEDEIELDCVLNDYAHNINMVNHGNHIIVTVQYMGDCHSYDFIKENYGWRMV